MNIKRSRLSVLLALAGSVASLTATGPSVLITNPAPASMTAFFRLVAHNTLADDSDFNASPAIAGRQLFLRSNRNLYCIEAMQTADAGKPE